MLQRKGFRIVLQQHHTFGGALTGYGSMQLQVWVFTELIALETRGTDNVLQHTLHALIHISLGKLTLLHGCHHIIGKFLCARHLQILPGMNLTCRTTGRSLVGPVGHDDAVEAPLLTQDGGQQGVALLGIFPIQQVIGRHDGPWLRLPHGNLESLEVEFPKRTLSHHIVHPLTVGLLRICSIMLDGSAHAIALHASHIGSSYLTGNQRVLGVVLEVTAAEWRTVQVHTRCQQHIHAIFQHLIADGSTHLLHQFRIPGAGQRDSYRETRAVIGAVGLLTGRADAKASRAVGHYGSADAQPVYGMSGTRSTRNNVGMLTYHSIPAKRSQERHGTSAAHQQL